MQLTSNFQTWALRLLAVVLGFALLASLFFKDEVRVAFAQLTDRAPLHFSIFGIRPQQRLTVELRDPTAGSGAFAAVTGRSVLAAVVTGFSGNSEEFFYTWSVKKRNRDGAEVPLDSRDIGTSSGFSQKVQTFAAIGDDCKPPRCLPLQSDTYGDLVLVGEETITLQQLKKFVAEGGGFLGLSDTAKWRENTDTGTYTIQYFDRLLPDGSSAYDRWAADNGLSSGPGDDPDRDGFVPKYGGQESEFSVANDPGASPDAFWVPRRAAWSRAMCGSIQQVNVTFTRANDGTCSTSSNVNLGPGRFYCFANPALTGVSQYITQDPVFGYTWTAEQSAIDSVKYSSAYDPSTQQGSNFYCSNTTKGGQRTFEFVSCGASTEFARFWEDSWKQYRDGDELKQDRNVRDAQRACFEAARGEYDENNNHINLTNCFLYDNTREEDIQTGCFHQFPGIADGGSFVGLDSSSSFTNRQEFVYGTDPNNQDSDGDGVVDAGDLMGYRQTRLNIPAKQLQELASSSAALDQQLRNDPNQALTPDEGATYEFSVDVEGRANIAHRAVDPANADGTIAARRIYHTSATKQLNLDLRSRISVTPNVKPTFPNKYQDTTIGLDLSLGGSDVVSPGDFYFRWYAVDANGQRSDQVFREGSGADGFDQLVLQGLDTGAIEYSADVYLRDPDTGELFYIKTISQKATINPGIQIVADSKTRCYRKGSVAKLTPKTERANGDLFFSWFVDGQEYDAATTGLTFDAEDPTLGGSGGLTDDVLLNNKVLELPITKDAPDEYNIQIAYTNSIASASNPNPAVASLRLFVCDPQQGTVVNIDNPSNQFNYRAGLKVGNDARALAEPGVTAELSVKLDPLLASTPNLTYNWKVQKNGKDATGITGNNSQKIIFPLEGNAGADQYDVLAEITDPSNRDVKYTASLNIALVTNASAAQQGDTVPDRPTNINGLIQNLANFRTLPLSRAVETIFRLGLILASLTALAFVVLGGNMYLVGSASGNTTAITEGRDRIVSALLGLALAFTSWIILNTINPDLLSLRNLSLSTNTQQQTTTTIPAAKPSQQQGTKAAGTSCTASKDCSGDLVCAPLVVGQAQQTCAKGCTKDADCGAGETCVNLASPAKSKTGYCNKRTP